MKKRPQDIETVEFDANWDLDDDYKTAEQGLTLFTKDGIYILDFIRHTCKFISRDDMDNETVILQGDGAKISIEKDDWREL